MLAEGQITDGTNPLAPIHFSTRTVPVRQQFAAWRDFMSEIVEITGPGANENGFEAEHSIWDLGNLVFTRALMPAGAPARRWTHLGRGSIDHWCLVLVRDGRSGVGPHPQSLHFRSLGRPFEGVSSDTDVLTIYIPRDLFSGAAGLLDRVPNIVPDGGVSGLLADYIASLDQRLPSLAEGDLPNLASATQNLIAACLLPTADRLAAADDPISLTLMERARRIIRANLHGPTFGPDELISQLFISRSRLYRLFEPVGGVARYIQRQRLLAAHAAISDPAKADRSILQIAESVGFGDASSFSRAFKQEFGHSPSDARSASSLGLPLAPVKTRMHGNASSPLGSMLRGLHA
ncbi:AraC family transcriptional regulator [Kaistia dalseonensis]|uniref:AraC-like DNA-binding protein n=1 Tax=Kaistia dalseonensis TaxID=410840 RepID=A0ABU0H9B3_9HYPH|nr:AraC family transcriptional regulator [Kaistia dalseonensis]MCX5495847.1 AraC family transcriptional regulator [Kaistia dalseonensis]MDQ0438448.1 AraC-like DNA-binding protein [Kaistia dalseonensis]